MEKTVDISLEFDYMFKEKPVAHVILWKNEIVECTVLTKDPMDNPLPFGNNLDSLMYFLKSRCFPETRANKDSLLEHLGLKYYSPLAIVKLTKGQQFDDFYWIRFKGDDTRYETIKLR